MIGVQSARRTYTIRVRGPAADRALAVLLGQHPLTVIHREPVLPQVVQPVIFLHLPPAPVISPVASPALLVLAVHAQRTVGSPALSFGVLLGLPVALSRTARRDGPVRLKLLAADDAVTDAQALVGLPSADTGKRLVRTPLRAELLTRLALEERDAAELALPSPTTIVIAT